MNVQAGSSVPASDSADPLSVNAGDPSDGGGQDEDALPDLRIPDRPLTMDEIRVYLERGAEAIEKGHSIAKCMGLEQVAKDDPLVDYKKYMNSVQQRQWESYLKNGRNMPPWDWEANKREFVVGRNSIKSRKSLAEGLAYIYKLTEPPTPEQVEGWMQAHQIIVPLARGVASVLHQTKVPDPAETERRVRRVFRSTLDRRFHENSLQLRMLNQHRARVAVLIRRRIEDLRHEIRARDAAAFANM